MHSQVDHTCFNPALFTYTVGNNPTYILCTKLDQNGRPDLAVVNQGSNTLSVLSGVLPVGTFSPSANYPMGNQPACVASDDINNDGYSDLIVANEGSNNISVLTYSSGIFVFNATYTVGSNPVAVVTTDMDLDGYQDILIANSGSNTISLLYGTLTGSFTSATNYTVGTSPTALHVNDVNWDGFSDLVIANKASNNISVLLGTASGTFATAVNYPVGTNPEAISADDLNQDGFMDLAVVNAGSNTISVLLGSASSTFGAPVDYAVGNHPNSVSIADFNNDGYKDLVTANENSNNVSILLGSANGVFATAVNYATGNAPRSVITNDLDRNGSPDILVANYSSNTVTVLLNGIPKVRIALTDWPGVNPKCPGNPSTLKVIEAGNNNFYQWNTGTIGYSISVNPTVTTTYSVDAVSTHGCFYSTALTLSVYPQPNITLTTNKSIMCVGETATLEASGGVSYGWFIPFYPGSAFNKRYVRPTVTSVYDVIGTDSNGCVMFATITQSVALCTGIQENEETEQLLVYPNPSTGELTVRFYNESASATISVVDMQGKEIIVSDEKNSADTFSKQLLLEDVAPGIYFVKVKTESSLQIRKLVIQ